MEDWFKALHISSFILGVIFLFLFLAIRKIITKVKSQNSPQELHEWVEKKDLAYWLIIIILFAVSTYTYKYSSNSDVITHWGFAGTIVSIILAIIAIVYTFFDNFTSKSSHQKLEESADKIKNITKKLDSNNLVDSSNKIEEIGLKLEAITSKMDKQLESINNGINEMHNNTNQNFSNFSKKLDDHLGLKAKNTYNSGNIKIKTSTNPTNLEEFFYTYADITLWNKVSLLSIGILNQKNILFNLKDVKRLSENISEILKPEDKVRSATYNSMISVSFFNTTRLFELYGFKILNNRDIEIGPEITKLLHSFVNECKTADKLFGIEEDIDKNSYEIALEAVNKMHDIN
ncbi:TPA: hypothetical protein QCR55_000943 [Bacillus cereus]|uniref:hypothetical protein n=1 Tax=unclassified Bacillus (in: firmicutes) TaxID=185979 RepID=UPI0022488C50|nr:hypothetical protein [Bacillus sp. AS_3]MCW4652363.1 hypothetical protein [Bacillus sp. AS_3]MCX2700000.1 hypothetical protein [Bacillus sp. AS_5]HDR4864611.1 hypothetical protein [Bacillus cereus]HDR4877714.1 hypothetical protein [Bacillus cereus]